MGSDAVGVAEGVREDHGVGAGDVPGADGPDSGPADGRPVGVGTGRGAGSRATQFQPKHPGWPTVRRRPPAAATKKPSQLLKDMRFVYGHESWEDRTEGH